VADHDATAVVLDTAATAAEAVDLLLERLDRLQHG
jgi:hypothetical protein